MLTEEKKIAYIAACVAVSNMGMFNYIEDKIGLYPDRWTGDAASDICRLAGFLMEDDEMEKIFTDEAEMWEASIKKEGLAKFVSSMSHHNSWMSKILEMHDE